MLATGDEQFRTSRHDAVGRQVAQAAVIAAGEFANLHVRVDDVGGFEIVVCVWRWQRWNRQRRAQMRRYDDV